jgi:hypothetical protein
VAPGAGALTASPTASQRAHRAPARPQVRRDIGGHADDDAQRQAQHGSKPDRGSDARMRESMAGVLSAATLSPCNQPVDVRFLDAVADVPSAPGRRVSVTLPVLLGTRAPRKTRWRSARRTRLASPRARRRRGRCAGPDHRHSIEHARYASVPRTSTAWRPSRTASRNAAAPSGSPATNGKARACRSRRSRSPSAAHRPRSRRTSTIPPARRPRRSRPATRHLPRLRRPDPASQRQGRRLRVLQLLPSRRHRPAMDARMGARRAARLA